MRAQRPSREQADAAVRKFLQDLFEVAEPLSFTISEDGEDGWAFTVCANDCTSYVHHDLTVEWYGSAYPENYDP